MSRAEEGRPLYDASRIAHALAEALAHACERIEIAGSIRREKSIINDIELVAIPRLREGAAIYAHWWAPGRTMSACGDHRRPGVLHQTAPAGKGRCKRCEADAQRWGRLQSQRGSGDA